MMYNVLKPYYRTTEVLAEIRECLDKGWTGMGYKTDEIEEAWKRYTKLPNAHFVNSATAGLHLAVKIFKDYYEWKDGDEIITTPLTFVSTNHVILYENLKPVFCDVDKYLCLDPDEIEKHLTSRTRAIMFMGMGGSVGQLDRVKKICDTYGLVLILDAAHMAGTKVDNKHIGHEADAAVFSFHAVKNMPTADAGMVCLNRSFLDSKARQLSWMGIDKNTHQRSRGGYSWHYDVPEVGYKYHGNSIMAAITLVALKYLDEDNDYRRDLARIYDNLLQADKVPVINSSRHLYQILVHNHEKVISYLNKKGIYPGVHYRSNLDYPMYHGSCPKAQDYADRLLSMPLHLGLSIEDIKHITDDFNNYTVLQQT